MKAKTEEFLYFLLWSAERLTQPTFRRLTDSYEAWAYSKGLLRELATLEKRQFVECSRQRPNERVYRLTEPGRLQALGGRDPQIQWSRPWDGYWRLVVFDIPVERNSRRDRLRRYLRSKGLGCLQHSVWVTPDPLDQERDILEGGAIDVRSLILLKAQPCAGETDAEMVAGAWDFERINRSYAKHLSILDRRPAAPLDDPASAKALHRWAAEEQQAWLAAMAMDPLLPSRLLPEAYLGQQAWERRVEVLRQAGQQARTFRLQARPA